MHILSSHCIHLPRHHTTYMRTICMRMSNKHVENIKKFKRKKTNSLTVILFHYIIQFADRGEATCYVHLKFT